MARELRFMPVSDGRCTAVSTDPVNHVIHEASDGSTRLDVGFVDGNKRIAEMFMLDMDATRAAAEAIRECILSLERDDSELEYEVSEHFDVDHQATLVVNDAVGPERWRYKIVRYPAAYGRWGRARVYVFNEERPGPLPMEGRVRSVKLAKWLMDAMMRYWEMGERE